MLMSTPILGGMRKEKAPQLQQLPPMDPKLLKQIRKAEKAEREFRKKFKVGTPSQTRVWEGWDQVPRVPSSERRWSTCGVTA